MKKIIFLFSGQSKTNSLSYNFYTNSNILKSYSKNIFTKEFKNIYDYTIFISTDHINIDNTINFFGKDKISNIHQLVTNYYYKDISNYIPKLFYFLDNGILTEKEYYILDVFNLLVNYNNIDCDYIIRINFDTEINDNIFNYINMIDSSDCDIIYKSDFMIAKPIVKNYYCNIMNNKKFAKFDIFNEYKSKKIL